MITNCYICGEDYEIDDSDLLKEPDPLNEDDADVCPECAEAALMFWHNLRLN
jgi:hypothetical protein